MQNKNLFKTSLIATGLALSGGAINELLIHGKDWGAIETQSEVIQKLSKGQVQLNLSTGHRCTGFMVSENKLITNNHCISYSGTKAKASSDGATWFKCDTLLHTNRALDYSVMECEGEHEYLKLDVNPLRLGDEIYTLHSNCDYYENPFCKVRKLYSPGKILEIFGSKIKHDTDTLGGSSGAPILSKKTNMVVALHNSGLGDGSNTSAGLYNMGINMRAIVMDMPRAIRMSITISGDAQLPQGNTAPYVPTGPVYKPRPILKKTFWQKVKCFFSRRC